MAMILLCQDFQSNDPVRQAELDFVKESNQKSNLFDEIEYVKSEKRMTYQDCIKLSKLKYKDEICVIANNDIIFDETLNLTNEIQFDNNVLLALTRWEGKSSPSMEGTVIDNCFFSHSQDVWIFVPKFITDFECDFMLGIPKCENRFVYEAISNGVNVFNPALDIRTFHHHESKIRTWKEDDSYKGDLFLPRLTTISDLRDVRGLLVKDNNDHNKLLYSKPIDFEINKKTNIDINNFKEVIDEDFDENFYFEQFILFKNLFIFKYMQFIFKKTTYFYLIFSLDQYDENKECIEILLVLPLKIYSLGIPKFDDKKYQAIPASTTT
jgi:hypothetical protein